MLLYFAIETDHCLTIIEKNNVTEMGCYKCKYGHRILELSVFLLDWQLSTLPSPIEAPLAWTLSNFVFWCTNKATHELPKICCEAHIVSKLAIKRGMGLKGEVGDWTKRKVGCRARLAWPIIAECHSRFVLAVPSPSLLSPIDYWCSPASRTRTLC